MTDTRSDNELLALAVNGDMNAYTQLFGRHNRKLRGLLFKFLRNKEDVDDLVHDVFIRAFEAIDTFRGESQFSTWLLRIGVNNAKNLWGARQRSRTYRFFEYDPFGDNDVTDVEEREIADRLQRLQGRNDGETPENLLNAKQMGEALGDAFEEMLPEFREVLELREVEGLSYSAIAERLQIPVNTVGSRISRARDALGVALAPYVDIDSNAFSHIQRVE